MKTFDCLIIGGGIVGASILNKLTRVGKKCLLLDKASDVATGATKANSGLVHAGYDPKPNTLKAKLNVRGNKLFPKICKRLGVKINICGALVVGDDKQKIEELYDRGIQNKVKVEILNKTQLHSKVKNLSKDLSCALYAPDAAIVSPYLFTISLVEESIINGAKVSLEEDIKKIEKQGEIFVVETNKGCYYSKIIINSAGAGYNEIARLLGSEQKKIEFRRGEYFVFDKTADMNVPCTIFPLPTELGKGVLITPTIDGNYLVGPTSAESDKKTVVTYDGLNEIKRKAKLIFPDINFRHAIREFSGIRTICGDDFVIEKSKKVENVINLAGICSPGLSSAPAIAEEVLKLLNFSLKEKPNLKKIEPYVMFKDMPKAKQKLLLKDKNYREIVCKCEQITKGDVLNVLNRPLKIYSVDAVKRRTNAGMGRCQGGFCFTKVVLAISQARKIGYEKVLKENRGSEVAIGEIREVSDDKN